MASNGVPARAAPPKRKLSSVQAFDKYDRGGSKGAAGTLSLNAFVKLCNENGCVLDEDQIIVAARVMDDNRNGTIDFKEFQEFWDSEAVVAWINDTAIRPFYTAHSKCQLHTTLSPPPVHSATT